MPEKTMVVGIDVAHPAPGSMENAPSVVAMVASMNNLYVHFPGSVRMQESRQEIQKLRRESLDKKRKELLDGKEDMVDSERIIQLLLERLDLYYRSNGRAFPENILIYRDGKFHRFRLPFEADMVSSTRSLGKPVPGSARPRIEADPRLFWTLLP